MTTPIKTQCPHCHTIFNIEKIQLDEKTANVCCEHCEQMFLVNNNLIVSADSYMESSHNRKINTASSHKKASISATSNIDDDILIHDDMIHDDMDIDTSDDKNLEYDSLDSMDAWLTQATDSNHSSTKSTPSPINTTRKPDKHSDISTDLLKENSHSTSASNQSPSSAQVALSSKAANSIHATIDNTADESWLEKLLKEQNQDEDTPNNDTDLSQLLLDMGVDFKEDDSQAAQSKRLEVQDKFSSTPSRRSVASLLWTAGCLVLALLLFAQYVMFNLNTLVKNPVHAERLQTLCSVFACSLPSADLSAFRVNDTKYQTSRINTKSGFSDISAAINNQSSQAQLYPHIKVSVYGVNALIGEFIAAPEQYLVGKQSQLAANSRKQVLFTVPVANTQITKVNINPIY